MEIYFVSCLVFILSIFTDCTCAVTESCDNEHKRNEIIKGLEHIVDPRHPVVMNATKDFYADMLLYDIQHKHRPQAIPDRKRGHDHNHHDLDKLQHFRKDMMEHMNLVCVSEILWELENLLGYPHEITTHATPSTHHVTQAHTTHHVIHAHTTHPVIHAHTTHPNIHAHTTTTTEAPTTTISMLNVSAECDPLLFVRALANGVPLTHPDAGRCTDNTNTQSEALLLRTCESPTPTTWTKGLNVMQNCARIPKYTPVAIFLFGQYVTDGSSMSGVFLKCTPTGFEMSVQLCGHGPQIFELSSGSGSTKQDANNYYIVQY